jgi:hypothetical protein
MPHVGLASGLINVVYDITVLMLCKAPFCKFYEKILAGSFDPARENINPFVQD